MPLSADQVARIRALSKDDTAAVELTALFENSCGADTQDEMTLRQQNRQMAELYRVTLELLNHRNLNELLEYVIHSAVAITCAAYAEIALLEGTSLVVVAASSHTYPVIGERPGRDVAVLRWMAFDTHNPIVLENYQTWPAKRAIYTCTPIYAVAELPILLGDHCIGVLSLGRTSPNCPFTPDQIEKGLMLTRLVGLIYDNVRLYDNALREINERKRVEQHVLELSFERNRAAVLSKFIHHASNEFRTPLSVMQTSLYLMGRVTEPEDKARKVAQIEQQIGRINHLVDMLVVHASIDGGEPLQKQPLSAYTLINACIDTLHNLIYERCLTLEVLIEDDIPLINADGALLCEAFNRLFDNAVRYTPHGGKIVVQMRALGKYIIIDITDSGVGIAEEDMAHIFERFYRSDHAHMTEGFGLGLSIAAKIIEMHGGRIEVESELGKGSTFEVIVPISA